MSAEKGLKKKKKLFMKNSLARIVILTFIHGIFKKIYGRKTI